MPPYLVVDETMFALCILSIELELEPTFEKLRVQIKVPASHYRDFYVAMRLDWDVFFSCDIKVLRGCEYVYQQKIGHLESSLLNAEIQKVFNSILLELVAGVESLEKHLGG